LLGGLRYLELIYKGIEKGAFPFKKGLSQNLNRKEKVSWNEQRAIQIILDEEEKL